MNRFKFRVWDIRENTYIKEPQPSPMMCSNGNLAYFSNNPKEMDNFIIEQCTGLKDKNGKLIYDGDICKTSDNKHFRLEIDDFGLLCACNLDMSDSIDWSYVVKKYYWNDRNCFEIIGNINENQLTVGVSNENT